MLPIISIVSFFILTVIVWFVTSLIVFIAARVVAGSEATYGKALGLILVGVILISIFSIMLLPFLGSIIGPIIVFIVWLALTKFLFHTGWLEAFGITILAIFIMITIITILDFVIALIGLPVLQQSIPIPTRTF